MDVTVELPVRLGEPDTVKEAVSEPLEVGLPVGLRLTVPDVVIEGEGLPV